MNARSVEKYLEKHARAYEYDEIAGFLVEVYDKADAVVLANELGLDAYAYITNGHIETFDTAITKKKAGSKVQAWVSVGEGTEVPLRQYEKDRAKEIKARCIVKSKIVSRKILSKAELELAISFGHLKEERIGRCHYIDRAALAEYIGGSKQLSFSTAKRHPRRATNWGKRGY